MTLVIPIIKDKAFERTLLPGDVVITNEKSSTLTTVGAGTLTGSLLASGILDRSGPTADFTDTTSTAADIINSIGNVGNGTSFRLRYNNTVAFIATIAGGTGVTVSGDATVGPVTMKDFLVTITSSNSQQVFTADTTNSSAVVTGLSSSQTGLLSVGMTVLGTGIQAGSKIISVQPGIGVTLDLAATATSTAPGVAITFSPSLTIKNLGQLVVGNIPRADDGTVTDITTVGAGTITAAAITGQSITRGGAQAGAAFTDTTDTAANIVVAQGNAYAGESWEVTIQNNTDGQQTIAAGTGVTLVGNVIIPANSWTTYRLVLVSASAVTMQAVSAGRNVILPDYKYTGTATGTGTAAAGDLEGAKDVVLNCSAQAAITLTTRTAAQIIAAIPNCQVGFKYKLTINNRNSDTLTLAGGTGVTITGTATIATVTWKSFIVTINSASAVGVQVTNSAIL